MQREFEEKINTISKQLAPLLQPVVAKEHPDLTPRVFKWHKYEDVKPVPTKLGDYESKINIEDAELEQVPPIPTATEIQMEMRASQEKLNQKWLQLM